MNKKQEKSCIVDVDVAKIVINNALNPRKSADPGASLVNSIKENGIITPLLVRPAEGGMYELVCGFRRMAAAAKLKMTGVPVYIVHLNDEEAEQARLIENIERESLSALDECRAISRLVNPNDKAAAVMPVCVSEAIKSAAVRTGKSVTYIRERLQVLTLPAKVLKHLETGEINISHAILISRIGSKGDQEELCEYIVENKTSVRSAEEHMVWSTQKLQDQAFDKKECAGCPYNGDSQEYLFDKETNIKGRCLNKQCFNNKVAQVFDKEMEAVKARGCVVMTAKEFGAAKYTKVANIAREASYGNLSKQQANKCDRCLELIRVVRDKSYGPGKEVEKYCKNVKCFKEMTKREEIEGGESSTDSRRDDNKKAERIRDTKNVFFIKAVQDGMTRTIGKALFCDALLKQYDYMFELDDDGKPTEDSVIGKFGLKEDPGSGGGWSIKQLFEMGDKKLDQLGEYVINRYGIQQHDLHELEYLAGKAGKTLAKDFVVTREYLEAHTTDTLLKLAKEMKLAADAENMKKSEIVEVFLGEFNKKGHVPKELLK